jgi:uncharacterized protein (TIGR03089 family)
VGALTVWETLRERVRREPAQPLITFVSTHEFDSQRMELSAASFANAVAKTAGLLRDDLDVQPGDRIAAHLPLHWQTAVWFAATAALDAIWCPGAVAGAVGVATSDRLDLIEGCPERVAVSLAAFGLPEGNSLPPGVIEAAIEMRVHPDEFTPYSPPAPQAPLLSLPSGDWTEEQLLARAGVCAANWGLQAGGRLLLTDADWDEGSSDCWAALLAAPLIRDAAAVLVAGSDPDQIAATTRAEGVTANASVRDIT